MQIAFCAPAAPATGALAVTVTTDRTLGTRGQALDASTGGMLTRAMASSRFTGKKDEILTVLAPANLTNSRIVLVGLGKPEDVTDLTAQAAGGSLYAAVEKSGETTVALLVDEPETAGMTSSDFAVNFALGLRLRSYRFDRYKTKEKPDQKCSLEGCTVHCADPETTNACFKTLTPLTDGVALARDLVSEPANVATPWMIMQRCCDLGGLGLTVEVLDRNRMTELGMGALLGVAQGSAAAPYLVVMKYDGHPEGPAEPPVAFCGKGVTFDSGGISIKPSNGMEDMKWDMAGAAVVVGVMAVLAGRKAKVNAVGLIGLVENLPSGTAQRPGDIVRSLSGQTIEVLNTDAEGRLVLADVLSYAQERFKPKALIDLATLTGAIIVALGNEYAGLFSNDDDLADQLTASGKAVGETVWRFPLGDCYDKELNSDAADIKNIASSRDAGSIIGAQFLNRFINGVPWAHLDIAGVTWAKKDRSVVPKGGTGFGVRLLDRYVAANHEAA